MTTRIQIKYILSANKIKKKTTKIEEMPTTTTRALLHKLHELHELANEVSSSYPNYETSHSQHAAPCKKLVLLQTSKMCR